MADVQCMTLHSYPLGKSIFNVYSTSKNRRLSFQRFFDLEKWWKGDEISTSKKTLKLYLYLKLKKSKIRWKHVEALKKKASKYYYIFNAFSTSKFPRWFDVERAHVWFSSHLRHFWWCPAKNYKNNSFVTFVLLNRQVIITYSTSTAEQFHEKKQNGGVLLMFQSHV